MFLSLTHSFGFLLHNFTKIYLKNLHYAIVCNFKLFHMYLHCKSW